MSNIPSIFHIFIFFIIKHSKPFISIFVNLWKNKKNKLKQFLQRILKEVVKKKYNTWNIRRLVDKTFVPGTQWTSVLYWKLSDFRSQILFIKTAHHRTLLEKLWLGKASQSPNLYNQISNNCEVSHSNLTFPSTSRCWLLLYVLFSSVKMFYQVIGSW